MRRGASCLQAATSAPPGASARALRLRRDQPDGPPGPARSTPVAGRPPAARPVGPIRHTLAPRQLRHGGLAPRQLRHGGLAPRQFRHGESAVRRQATMSTTIRATSPAGLQPGRLLGARQLAEVVRRAAASPAQWLARVRLNAEGRWYERIHLDDSHEVWIISWLPGQATGFHDHGGSAGAFAVVWGTLVERRVLGARTTGQILAKPVGAGGSRAFGPRYIHDVRNAAASAVTVSVHAYSPPLAQMTRYDLTPAGLVSLGTETAAAW